MQNRLIYYYVKYFKGLAELEGRGNERPTGPTELEKGHEVRIAPNAPGGGS